MSSGVLMSEKWMSKEVLCEQECSLGGDDLSLGGGELSQELPALFSIDCN
jgi:hypothetical protein